MLSSSVIPIHCHLPLQSRSSPIDFSGVSVVVHWCVLVPLELLDRPYLAGIANSDEPCPPPPLESSIPTPSGHP